MGEKYIATIRAVRENQSIVEVQSTKQKWPSSWNKFYVNGLRVILFLALIAFVAVLLKTYFSSPQNNPPPPDSAQLASSAKNNIVKTGNKKKIDIIVEETANRAFYQGRKEAQEEYDKNFTTLLSILAIFGIVWPVIIGLLQFNFSEKELNKITDANNKADAAIAYLKEFKQSFSQQDSTKALLIQYRVFSQIYRDMGQDKKSANSSEFGIFNHYFGLALEFKLRSFVLDERNVEAGSVRRILKAFDNSKPKSDDNLLCRNDLETCKAIADDIMRNAEGTFRAQQAQEIYELVEAKCKEFGGFPGEDDDPEVMPSPKA